MVAAGIGGNVVVIGVAAGEVNVLKHAVGNTDYLVVASQQRRQSSFNSCSCRRGQRTPGAAVVAAVIGGKVVVIVAAVVEVNVLKHAVVSTACLAVASQPR